MNEKIHLV